MRPYPNLSAAPERRAGLAADPRPPSRRAAPSRPGVLAVLLAVAVVAALTLGLHFLYR